YDKDGDGQVALYEWKAAGQPLDRFLAMDRNGDGFLTAEEVLRYEAEQNKGRGGNGMVASNGNGPGGLGRGNFGGGFGQGSPGAFGPPGGFGQGQQPGGFGQGNDRGFGPPPGGNFGPGGGNGPGGDPRQFRRGGGGGGRPDGQQGGGGGQGRRGRQFSAVPAGPPQ